MRQAYNQKLTDSCREERGKALAPLRIPEKVMSRSFYWAPKPHS